VSKYEFDVILGYEEEIKPRYRMTCIWCKFLGQYENYDLYFHREEPSSLFVALANGQENIYMYPREAKKESIESPIGMAYYLAKKRKLL
jgi:hypothetical protein